MRRLCHNTIVSEAATCPSTCPSVASHWTDTLSQGRWPEFHPSTRRECSDRSGRTPPHSQVETRVRILARLLGEADPAIVLPFRLDSSRPPISGPRRDGHQFCQEARKSGSSHDGTAPRPQAFALAIAAVGAEQGIGWRELDGRSLDQGNGVRTMPRSDCELA